MLYGNINSKLFVQQNNPTIPTLDINRPIIRAGLNATMLDVQFVTNAGPVVLSENDEIRMIGNTPFGEVDDMFSCSGVVADPASGIVIFSISSISEMFAQKCGGAMRLKISINGLNVIDDYIYSGKAISGDAVMFSQSDREKLNLVPDGINEILSLKLTTPNGGTAGNAIGKLSDGSIGWITVISDLSAYSSTVQIRTMLNAYATLEYVGSKLALKADADAVSGSLNTILSELESKADSEAVAEALGLKASLSELNSFIQSINTELAKKANSTDVSTSISLKANISDVNTAMALKADVSTVNESIAAINASLGQKANASDVSTSLALKADSAAMNTELAKKADSSAVNKMLVGTTAPAADTGNAGDVYLNVTTGDLYSRSVDAWAVVGNVKTVYAEATPSAAGLMSAADKAKLASITAGYLGYYATPDALTAAHAAGNDGEFASVGSTDTLWAWDSDSAAWVNTSSATITPSWDNLTGKPETFPPATHAHGMADVTGLADALAGKASLTDGKVPAAQLPDDIGGGERSVFCAASATVEAGQHAIVTASGVTVTLPASPADGDRVRVSVTGTVTDAIVAPGTGATIGGDTSLVLNAAHSGALLVYLAASTKWMVVDPVVPNINTGTGGGSGAATAAETSIADAGSYYTGTTVESALQEIGALLAGLETAINTITGTEA